MSTTAWTNVARRGISLTEVEGLLRMMASNKAGMFSAEAVTHDYSLNDYVFLVERQAGMLAARRVRINYSIGFPSNIVADSSSSWYLIFQPSLVLIQVSRSFALATT